jgi:hypothetical protein
MPLSKYFSYIVAVSFIGGGNQRKHQPDSSATTPDPGTEEATPEDKPEEQTLDGDSNKPKKVWMDFEQFCKCFK